MSATSVGGPRQAPSPLGGWPGRLALAASVVWVAFLLPMAWPALHGVTGVAQAAWQGLGRAEGLGALWPDARVAGLLLQSLGLALLAGAVATAAAAACAAALLPPLHRRLRLALVAALAASFCLGSVVHLLAWRSLFPGVTGGAAGWALAGLVLGLRYTPLATALLLAGLAALDRAELETATCAGGNLALWRIARVRLARLLGMSLAAVGALVFAEAELPPLLGVHVYAEEFLSQVALEPDPGAAAAQGWPLMALAALAAVWMARLPRLAPSAAGSVQLGWLGRWTQAPAALRRWLPVAALSLSAAPTVLLARAMLTASGRWPAHALAALGATLWVAAAAALLASMAAWALAATASRAGDAAVRTTRLLAMLAMLWPTALTGLAIAALDTPAWAPDVLPLVLAHALRILPFAGWLLLAMRDARPRAADEQLRVLGLGGWAAFRHVRLPAAAPGLLAAFSMGVGLSLAELSATVLTVPPGMETVILRLYNLLHYGDQRGVLMLALLQGLAVAGFAAAAAAAFARLPRAGTAHA